MCKSKKGRICTTFRNAQGRFEGSTSTGHNDGAYRGSTPACHPPTRHSFPHCHKKDLHALVLAKLALRACCAPTYTGTYCCGFTIPLIATCWLQPSIAPCGLHLDEPLVMNDLELCESRYLPSRPPSFCLCNAVVYTSYTVGTCGICSKSDQSSPCVNPSFAALQNVVSFKR